MEVVEGSNPTELNLSNIPKDTENLLNGTSLTDNDKSLVTEKAIHASNGTHTEDVELSSTKMCSQSPNLLKNSDLSIATVVNDEDATAIQVESSNIENTKSSEKEVNTSQHQAEVQTSDDSATTELHEKVDVSESSDGFLMETKSEMTPVIVHCDEEDEKFEDANKTKTSDDEDVSPSKEGTLEKVSHNQLDETQPSGDAASLGKTSDIEISSEQVATVEPVEASPEVDVVSNDSIDRTPSKKQHIESPVKVEDDSHIEQASNKESDEQPTMDVDCETISESKGEVSPTNQDSSNVLEENHPMDTDTSSPKITPKVKKSKVVIRKSQTEESTKSSPKKPKRAASKRSKSTDAKSRDNSTKQRSRSAAKTKTKVISSQKKSTEKRGTKRRASDNEESTLKTKRLRSSQSTKSVPKKAPPAQKKSKSKSSASKRSSKPKNTKAKSRSKRR